MLSAANKMLSAANEVLSAADETLSVADETLCAVNETLPAPNEVWFAPNKIVSGTTKILCANDGVMALHQEKSNALNRSLSTVTGQSRYSKKEKRKGGEVVPIAFPQLIRTLGFSTLFGRAGSLASLLSGANRYSMTGQIAETTGRCSRQEAPNKLVGGGTAALIEFFFSVAGRESG